MASAIYPIVLDPYPITYLTGTITYNSVNRVSGTGGAFGN
jgi:hypothetical protein